MLTDTRRFILASLCAFLLVAIWNPLFTPVPAYSEESQPKKSLYERMGGYDVISAIVEDAIPKLWDDPQTASFFVGMGTDTREMLLQKNKNLMCYNTGGPCKPFNRPLEKVHAGLNVTDKEFNVLLQYIKKALIKHHVGSQEQDELMAKIEGLRPYIVQQKEKAK